MSFKNTYRHKETSELITVKNLGLGEKKIKRIDGTEEKITNGALSKDYVFVSSTDKRINNISRKLRTDRLTRRNK